MTFSCVHYHARCVFFIPKAGECNRIFTLTELHCLTDCFSPARLAASATRVEIISVIHH